MHIDLCGPTRSKGLNGEEYFMLLVDEFTRMTWVCLLKRKSEDFECFKIFKELVENEVELRIKCLRSDNGGEFTSKEFNLYCEENGIKIQFLAARTPQQNGVAERKNKTMTEMAKTMLNDSQISDKFWGQAVHTSVHILNKGLLRNDNDKNPYELWIGRLANVKHFRIFGSKCFIKKDDGKVNKFDSRVDEGIFFGYSSKRKAYKCYNLRLDKIVETINVKIDESNSSINKQEDSDTQEEEEMIQEEEQEYQEEEPQDEEEQGSIQQEPLTPLKTPNRRVQKNHPSNQITGDKSTGVETRRRKQGQTLEQAHLSLLSIIHPKNVEEAKRDECWIKAMEEELSQIKKNDTCELVPRPKDKNVIGIKWVFKNKLDENG